MTRTLLVLTLLVLSGACAPDEEPLPVAAPVPDGASPGPAPVRLLTRFELHNTLRDLTGADVDALHALAPDPEVLGFDNNAEAHFVGLSRAEQLMALAEEVAAEATTDLGSLVACNLDSDPTGCGHAFVADFGQRAFRRPLDEDELTRYRSLYDAARALDGAASGVARVIESLLQAPSFLYRIELGLDHTETGGSVRLSAWEMASRLSYFLWASMPDDQLFQAAADQALITPEQVETHARRMLADGRSRRMLAHFESQWLQLNKMDYVTHIFLQWQMVEETQRFIEHVLFASTGTLAELLTAPYSVMNQELADHYDVAWPGGNHPDDFVVVPLDPDRRSGLLTHGGVLGVQGRPEPDVLKAPIRRGRMIREQLLCQPVSPPPAAVVAATVIDPEGPALTARDHLAGHLVEPACQGCHTLMDPIGLALEQFDAQGRWREVDHQGLLIDPSGELTGTTDADGPFEGAVGLGDLLAGSKQVADCVARQWFRFAYGRTATSEDAGNLDALEARFAETDANVVELIVAITQTDAFLYRPAIGGE